MGSLSLSVMIANRCRPMGYASAMVNKGGQSAGEIVLEMTIEAHDIIKRASRFTNSSKL